MSYEQEHLKAGRSYIIGMDEAGYGAWAGPVVAAAVCLGWNDAQAIYEQLKGVKDSKQMTPRQRETAYDIIRHVALGAGTGHATPSEINEQGLSAALTLAYSRAYDDCVTRLRERDLTPQALLLDGVSGWKSFPHESSVVVKRIPKGDTVSLSIAAASVLAKVWRDRELVKLSEQHPDYGFERHKGYGTQAHRDALESHGVLAAHRRNYKPIRALLDLPK